MKKLNNKGYMLIEIILASVITFAIAFSLMNLIINFKNKNEDLYNETYILDDKVNITKNIMDDILGGEITSIDIKEDEENIGVNITIETPNNTTVNKKLEITNSPDKKKKIIKYGDYDGTNIKTGNKSYYRKEITKGSIIVGTPTYELSDGESLILTIPLSSIYSKKNQDIRLFFKCKRKSVLQAIQSDQNDKIWQYKEEATKIVIENSISDISGVEKYDISSLGNHSVVGYYDSSSKTIHIQANGKIYANTDSSFLFSGFKNITEITGLENLDTSNVTNMNSMFSNTENLTSIGTLKIYANNIENIFLNCKKCNLTIDLYSNPENYTNTFSNAATENGTQITINYKESATNIDQIIATKSEDSNILKGNKLD